MACAAAEGAFAHRAGPALPSYLALHHAGFSVPLVSPRERWALTPPFHPCQTMRALRRRLAGFPARCHRAALRRRSILCGTFRGASSGTGIPASPPGFAPWRYQARCPVKSSAPHKSGERASGRCPDFPPVLGHLRPRKRPAKDRDQRSPGPPANQHYIIDEGPIFARSLPSRTPACDRLGFYSGRPQASDQTNHSRAMGELRVPT